MSKYAWQRGTITIPSKRWVDFRHEIYDAHNKAMEDTYETAVKVWTLLKDGQEWQEASQTRGRNMMGRPSKYTSSRFSCRILSRMAYQSIFRKGGDKILKPRTKDFPTVNASTRHISIGEAHLSFNVDRRRVTWDVPENNRAPERAREHPTAKAFFKALDRTTWTRKSGGKIIGNDEYNRDSRAAGAGGNYVVNEYSKARQKRGQRGRFR